MGGVQVQFKKLNTSNIQNESCILRVILEYKKNYFGLKIGLKS